MNTDQNRVIGIGEWMLVFILSAIPVVNIVFYLLWAYGPGVPLSKRNYARAAIYLFLLGFLIVLIFAGLGLIQTTAP